MHKSSRIVVMLRILLLSYLITGFLLLILTLITLKLDVSNSIVAGGIIFIYIISSFIGGFLTGKGANQKRFLWGIGIGAMYFIVLILISILTNSVIGLNTGRILSVMLICLVSGMAGGMIS